MDSRLSSVLQTNSSDGGPLAAQAVAALGASGCGSSSSSQSFTRCSAAICLHFVRGGGCHGVHVEDAAMRFKAQRAIRPASPLPCLAHQPAWAASFCRAPAAAATLAALLALPLDCTSAVSGDQSRAALRASRLAAR